MITDEDMTRWLTQVADEVPLPAGGLEAATADLADAPRSERPSTWARFVTRPTAAAAAVALFVGIAGTVAVVHGTAGSSSPTSHAQTAMSKQVEPAAAPAAPPVPAAAAAGSSTGSSTGAGSGSASTLSSGSGVTSPAVTVAPGVPAAGARVVRTATVELTVPAAQVTSELSRVRALAGGTGYVSDSTTSLAGSAPSGTITLRIPSAQYAAVRDALAGGGYGTVASLQEQGQDVTAQYTDIAARISALEATRTSYLTLLSRASSIGDVLAVQAQLTQVQQQIEQLQGQQKVLADQSDDATITVTVDEPVALPSAPHHSNGWSRALSRAGRSVVHAGQDLIAASGVALVVVVGLAVLTTAGVVVYRRVRRRLI